jgi:hypothetical protein
LEPAGSKQVCGPVNGGVLHGDMMKRLPQTPNRAAELMVEVEKLLPKVLEMAPRAIGVVLAGGLARGFADECSDVDILVFHHRNEKVPYMPYQYLPQGNCVEFGACCFEDGNDPDKDSLIWTMANRWDKSYAKILHDPEGELQALFKKKLVFRPGELKALKGKARDAWWFIDECATSWITRGNIIAAHHAINRGIDLLLDYLYLKNREFIPYDKWKSFYAMQLEILPDSFEERVGKALIIRELSAECVQARQAVLDPLMKEAYQLPNKKDGGLG